MLKRATAPNSSCAAARAPASLRHRQWLVAARQPRAHRHVVVRLDLRHVRVKLEAQAAHKALRHRGPVHCGVRHLAGAWAGAVYCCAEQCDSSRSSLRESIEMGEVALRCAPCARCSCPPRPRSFRAKAPPPPASTRRRAGEPLPHALQSPHAEWLRVVRGGDVRGPSRPAAGVKARRWRLRVGRAGRFGSRFFGGVRVG